MKRTTCLHLLAAMIVFGSQVLSARPEGVGTIKGVVKSAEEQEPLAYANVIITGTALGAAADLNGHYIIRNVPAGKYAVKASLLGYNARTSEVVVQSDQPVELNFTLTHVDIEGQEVVIQAQAAGQIAAISQQLASNTIVNVVSSARIQEIPDANAAESVGRLPGVSIQRTGGEGNKVVIRGLSPKFSAINLNGVRMPATGSGDRSTDISMISPYMLEGIEVMKALTPDKDADVIGGSVDFRIKEAQSGLSLNAIAQTGYNGMINAVEDYKFVLSGASRFFDDRFGISVQADVERRDRSADELAAGYEIVNPTLEKQNDVDAISATFNDLLRKKQRFGGSLMTDYRFDLGKMTLSSVVSRVKNDVIRRSETFNSSLNEHTYYMAENTSSLTVMTNALGAEYDFGLFRLDGAVTGSFSENETPENLNVSFVEGAALTNARGLDNPFDLVGTAKNYIPGTNINTMNAVTGYTKESEIAAALNAAFDWNLGSEVTSTFKLGGKIRHKNKYNNDDAKYREFVPYAYTRQTVLDNMPELRNVDVGAADINKLPYALFINPGYDVGTFLGGQFAFGPTVNFDQIRRMYGILDQTKDTFRPGVTGSMMWNDFPASLQDDYDGTEDYAAGYVMATINVARDLVFMPGVRYEHNKTEYTGIRGDNSLEKERGYAHHDTTITQTDQFWLPMVHLKYDPLSWLNIRLAFTKSLSRPNYGQIIPSYNLNLNSGVLAINNYALKPARSDNYDVVISLLDNKVGLFSVGLFYKKINDLVYNTGRIASLDPKSYNVPDNLKPQYIQTFVNNEYEAIIKGMELDWQTNFWYLPKPFDGLVLNVNYTHLSSTTRYTRIEVKTEVVGYDTLFGGVIIVPRTELRNVKSTYDSRVVDQPDDIINVALGYDFQGFSARLSMLYQDDILTSTNFWPELRAGTETYVRWDFSAKQKLPVTGLQIFFNLYNISNEVDRSLIRGSSYPQSEEHYGMTGDIGVRYHF